MLGLTGIVNTLVPASSSGFVVGEKGSGKTSPTPKIDVVLGDDLCP